MKRIVLTALMALAAFGFCVSNPYMMQNSLRRARLSLIFLGLQVPMSSMRTLAFHHRKMTLLYDGCVLPRQRLRMMFMP